MRLFKFPFAIQIRPAEWSGDGIERNILKIDELVNWVDRQCFTENHVSQLEREE